MFVALDFVFVKEFSFIPHSWGTPWFMSDLISHPVIKREGSSGLQRHWCNHHELVWCLESSILNLCVCACISVCGGLSCEHFSNKELPFLEDVSQSHCFSALSTQWDDRRNIIHVLLWKVHDWGYWCENVLLEAARSLSFFTKSCQCYLVMCN